MKSQYLDLSRKIRETALPKRMAASRVESVVKGTTELHTIRKTPAYQKSQFHIHPGSSIMEGKFDAVLKVFFSRKNRSNRKKICQSIMKLFKFQQKIYPASKLLIKLYFISIFVNYQAMQSHNVNKYIFLKMAKATGELLNLISMQAPFFLMILCASEIDHKKSTVSLLSGL